MAKPQTVNLVDIGSSPFIHPNQPEKWPSGLRHSFAKREGRAVLPRFESWLLRQLSACSSVGLEQLVSTQQVGGSSPSGQARLIALGIVAVHLAFNHVTGVRFSQGEPK